MVRAPHLVVLGHVEWVECLRGDPARVVWSGAAGACIGAAATAGHLGAEVDVLCTVGGDAAAATARAALAGLPLRAHVVVRDVPQRRVEVGIDDRGERTLRLIGDKPPVRGDDPLPWELVDGAEAVLAIAADAAALRRARRAPVLVASARWLPVLRTAGVRLDVLLASGSDPDERYAAGGLEPPPDAVVTTGGAAGGAYAVGAAAPVAYAAAAPPPRIRSTYGAGDAFAGGLAASLAAGEPLDRALATAARAGAAALASDGPYPWLA